MPRPDARIPESELDVLRALWRLGRGTVRDVKEDLQKRGRRLAHTTVLTLLGRLERRGHVKCNRDGSANLYRAMTSRGQVMAARLGTLVEQLGEGQAAPLILQLVRSQRLSADDVRELREMLTQLEKEAKGRKTD